MTKAKANLARGRLTASPTHLLHRALQLALDFHVAAAGDSAITQRQYTVLAAAAEAEDLTQNDLVRATGIDRSTLADLVGRLLAKELLLRERSATDARANTVCLSPAGREALHTAAIAAAEADRRLLALLSPKKRESLMKVLASLAAAADAPSDLDAARGPAAKAKKAKGKKKAKAAHKRGASPRSGEAAA
jgi:DNA-binding MarR family transcriptional regulator